VHGGGNYAESSSSSKKQQFSRRAVHLAFSDFITDLTDKKGQEEQSNTM
jgi:hypothetical protein